MENTKYFAQQISNLIWSIVPAYLIGSEFGSWKIGLGIFLIMILLTSIVKDLDFLKEKAEHDS